MTVESTLILVAAAVIAAPAVVVSALFAAAYFAASRRVDAVLSEEIDLHTDRVLYIVERDPEPGRVDDSPLLREIYGAQSLARDGVDIYKSAPKEMAP